MKALIKKNLPAPFWKFGKKIYRLIIPVENSVSGNYKLIKSANPKELDRIYGEVWKDDSIPQKQLKITSQELPNFKKTTPFKEFIYALSKINNPKQKQSLLEVGCSTGYHGEIIDKLKINMTYEGCDYSEAFINEARVKYPGNKFCLSDATDLFYKDSSFDVVVSGCCILHIADYPKAIAESVRVAKKYVVFHRTPVLHMTKTSFFEKTGYGLKMFEIFFNETELYGLFEKNNLIVKNVVTLSKKNLSELDEPMFTKTYLCEKV